MILKAKSSGGNAWIAEYSMIAERITSPTPTFVTAFQQAEVKAVIIDNWGDLDCMVKELDGQLIECCETTYRRILDWDKYLAIHTIIEK